MQVPNASYHQIRMLAVPTSYQRWHRSYWILHTFGGTALLSPTSTSRLHNQPWPTAPPAWLCSRPAFWWSERNWKWGCEYWWIIIHLSIMMLHFGDSRVDTGSFRQYVFQRCIHCCLQIVDEVVDEIFIGGRTFGLRWGLLATPFPNTVHLTWSILWVIEKYRWHLNEVPNPFSGQNEADLCLEVCS